MTKETYYAVRIGKKPRHRPYFMVNGRTPWLFMTREEAQAAAPKQPETEVVKVTLHD